MENKENTPKKQYDYEYYHLNATVTTDVFPIDVGHQIFTCRTEHIHNNYPYYLLHFVVKGKGHVELNGKKQTFGRNAIFILPPDTPVTYYTDPQNPWEYYWINFNGVQAKNILHRLGVDDENYFLSYALPAAKKYFVQSLAARHDLFGRAFTVLGNLYKVFGLIAQTRKYTEIREEKKKVLFNRMLEYITLHLYDKDLSAKDVAQHFYISDSYFSCLFKKNLNVSFKEYVNYERIKKATELIETSNLYVKTVGFTVGFSDPLYFGKVFKKYRLYSPSEYQKRVHAEHKSNETKNKN